MFSLKNRGFDPSPSRSGQLLRSAPEVQVVQPEAAERLGRVLLDAERQGPGVLHGEDHRDVVLRRGRGARRAGDPGDPGGR